MTLDSSDTWQLFLLLFLLICSSFFSASETALMSLSKIRIRHMVEEGVKKSTTIQRLVDSPNQLLATILVGNNVVNIGASALATSLAIESFGDTGVGIATGAMTLVVLMFGEITPKSLAAQYSEKVALLVVKPVAFLVKALHPLVVVLMFVTEFIVRLLGGSGKKISPFITQEELMTIVNVSHEEGVLQGEEREMIHNVFEFGDTFTKDVMTIRANVVAVPIDISYSELMAVYKEEQFSRLPV